MSELLEVRVISEPEAAAQAVVWLGELLELDRLHGPYPSRKTPELVCFYLAGRLREPKAAVSGPDGAEWLVEALAKVREQVAAALADETADRQCALEQADASIGALVERFRRSPGRAARAPRRGTER